MVANGTLDGGPVSKYETEEGLREVAAFLRGRSGMPLRPAIEMDKRVEYFKGEKLVKFLVTNTKKGRPQISTEEEALRVCKALLRHEYFHRSEKVKDMKGAGERHLEVSRDNRFEKDGYYTWIFLGSQRLSHLFTALIIIGFLIITCFPIWPRILKVWMWYLSVTLLVFMVTFLSIRCLLFFFAWILGYEFWVLPRLFDETLAFAESFVPVYTFEKGTSGQGIYRIIAVGGVIAFCVWAYNQPTDFDTFIAAQSDFMSDLYAGKLISDVSQQSKQDIDKPKVQSLEDILKELDQVNEDAEEEAEIERRLEELLAEEMEMDEDEDERYDDLDDEDDDEDNNTDRSSSSDPQGEEREEKEL
ncbi:unnamed protein product [Ascophyllum nodosum]